MLFSDSVGVISVFPITATSSILSESAIIFLRLLEAPLLSAELAEAALRMRRQALCVMWPDTQEKIE